MIKKKLDKTNKVKFLKALAIILELSAIGLLFYLIISPVSPEIEYLFYNNKAESRNLEKVKEETAVIAGNLPKSDYAVSQNRLIITKIGVNAPIIQTDSENEGLNKGVWLMPQGVTPGKTGNTIITGHRFKYLPPNNTTFYLFHKLEVGDIVSIIWDKENYYYKIKEIKIVDETDLSVYDGSNDSILTMFTCHPIYSSQKRLVVISSPIENIFDKNSD